MILRVSEKYQGDMTDAAKALEVSAKQGLIHGEDCYFAAITVINVALESIETDAATLKKLEEAAQTLHHLMVPHNDQHHGPLN